MCGAEANQGLGMLYQNSHQLIIYMISHIWLHGTWYMICRYNSMAIALAIESKCVGVFSVEWLLLQRIRASSNAIMGTDQQERVYEYIHFSLQRISIKSKHKSLPNCVDANIDFS